MAHRSGEEGGSSGGGDDGVDPAVPLTAAALEHHQKRLSTEGPLPPPPPGGGGGGAAASPPGGFHVPPLPPSGSPLPKGGDTKVGKITSMFSRMMGKSKTPPPTHGDGPTLSERRAAASVELENIGSDSGDKSDGRDQGKAAVRRAAAEESDIYMRASSGDGGRGGRGGGGGCGNLTDAMLEAPLSGDDALAAMAGAADGGDGGGGGGGEEEEEEGGSGSESDQSEAEGEFKGGKGDALTSRYVIEKEVGRGTFGRVLRCLDKKADAGQPGKVAVKVVHDAGRYYELSLIEAEILRDVNGAGGRGISHCCVLLNFFKLEGHACMVFETLGLSLYEFLKANDYIPFPLYCVQVNRRGNSFSKRIISHCP